MCIQQDCVQSRALDPHLSAWGIGVNVVHLFNKKKLIYMFPKGKIFP